MWLTLIIQWFHVLLGIFWFGSVLYLNVIVIPTILRFPVEQQRIITVPLGAFTERILTPVSILVILLGIVRGTVLGPIHDLSFLLGTSYGITFLVAMLMTIALALWGTFVSGRAAKQLNEMPLTEGMLAQGTTSVAFATQLQRVKLFVLLELVGFFLIFTTMILMGFGI
ncbi:hypothetical protein KDA_52620 [Dictyobacter alpinus]|uniref:Copper resistance protein D domain-containing protein n=1 Tax=Dictyobacter alpinus TaxID=2014873 RepID=A0A402BEF4_9CHLR|nr:hypothetical protein [Dictyobacter alpinus]GCE29778.1 hypothetical protein KDA_52620 [Dictyobacter alpinus]